MCCVRRSRARGQTARQPLPEDADVAAYSEWHEVMLAQAGASAERAQSASKLRNEFQVYEGRVGEDIAWQQQVVDLELASMKEERDAIEQR